MNNDWLASVKNQLDSVGPGFCLAKFFEVSMHLQSGHNHSCVHPRTHRVSADEINCDPHSLHNSQHKQSVRQQMFAGERPKECGYCWNMESLGAISDRVYFSSNHLSTNPKIIDFVRSQGPQARFYPKRAEISFSTACNFKCTYCGPEISSRWMKDLRQHGPVKLNRELFSLESIEQNQKMPIEDEDQNPYIEAFWSWLPEAYPHLQTLRVTGGEPLMSTNTFRLLDWIEQHPRTDLELGINSNLGVPKLLIDRFVNRLAALAQQQVVGQITVWTSGESSGAQAEYTRLGLDYNIWLNNIVRILDEVPGATVRIMTTYSVLNMGTYIDFLKDMYRIKTQFPDRLIVDTHTYLQYPKLMAIDVLTADFLDDIKAEESYIRAQPLASEHEIFQAQRCREYFEERLANPWSDRDAYRADFYRYFTQFDQRNDTDFQTTFPRLNEFFALCKDLV